MNLFIIAIIVFISDQFTKHQAMRYLMDEPSLPVIRNVLHLTYVQNRGIAFGLFQDSGIFLLVLIAICVAGLVFYFASTPQTNKLERICYGLILGGALGNLYDRIRFGFVIDFIDLRIWPVFNIADSCITIGVSFLILSTIRKMKHAS